MIIDFTISNFRSFCAEETLSLYVESSSTHLSSNIAYPIDDKLGVLKTAGVYGANASGKSNLLKAIEALKFIICHSGDLKDGDHIPCYEPFLLNEDNSILPIVFEIEFICKDNLRYIYNVSFNEKRIIKESLDYYPSRAKANLFKREDGDTWENVVFGGHYKGGRKKFAFFDNNSYLSKAGNSADSPEIIRNIYNYFRNDIFSMDCHQRYIGSGEWRSQSEAIKSMSEILSSIDTGISSFEYKDIEFNENSLPTNMPDSIKQQIIEAESKAPVFKHVGIDGKVVEFSEDMESQGTTKLFGMLPVLLTTLGNGGVLIMDELDTSFHPHIAELIIQLFNDPSVNKNNSQLIYSTHNINLMSPDLMRRDQLWLVEKNNGASTLNSLDDFDRNTLKMNSPYSKWYDEGRLGAVPGINYASIAAAIKSRTS